MLCTEELAPAGRKHVEAGVGHPAARHVVGRVPVSARDSPRTWQHVPGGAGRVGSPTPPRESGFSIETLASRVLPVNGSFPQLEGGDLGGLTRYARWVTYRLSVVMMRSHPGA